MKKIQEYKRKCKECGTIWHSLVKREEEIKNNIRDATCSDCAGTCAMCGGGWFSFGGTQQARYNKRTSKSELDNLRRCPKCGSHNYEEIIQEYESKNKKEKTSFKKNKVKTK